MVPRIPSRTIVEDFSKRKFTVSQDRLPALSTIAKEYAIESNDRYLAGIWEASLSNGLSWRGYSRTQNRYSQDYIAPSWSWASYNGGVCLNITEIFYELLMKIHSCSVNHVSDSPFGIVSGGELVLEAPFRQLQPNEWKAVYSPKFEFECTLIRLYELWSDETGDPRPDTDLTCPPSMVTLWRQAGPPY